MQTFCGIDHPIAGAVLARRRHFSGATVRRAEFGRLGLEFEIAWIVPADQLDEAAMSGRKSIQPLDLAKEIARYGADVPGGIGISRVAAT